MRKYISLFVVLFCAVPFGAFAADMCTINAADSCPKDYFCDVSYDFGVTGTCIHCPETYPKRDANEPNKITSCYKECAGSAIPSGDGTYNSDVAGTEHYDQTECPDPYCASEGTGCNYTCNSTYTHQAKVGDKWTCVSNYREGQCIPQNSYQKYSLQIWHNGDWSECFAYTKNLGGDTQVCERYYYLNWLGVQGHAAADASAPERWWGFCESDAPTTCAKFFESIGQSVCGDGTMTGNVSGLGNTQKDGRWYINANVTECKCTKSSDRQLDHGTAGTVCTYEFDSEKTVDLRGTVLTESCNQQATACDVKYCASDNGETCRLVPRGRYNDKNTGPDSLVCNKCPAGQTTQAEGANVCGTDFSVTKFCDSKGCFKLNAKFIPGGLFKNTNTAQTATRRAKVR